MSDDTHVSDICWMVHQLAELLCGEVDHREIFLLSFSCLNCLLIRLK
jgi:hypothetical protein